MTKLSVNLNKVALLRNARAFAAGAFDGGLKQYARAAECAQSLGLGVNAGHDLNRKNLPAFCTIPGILEVSIGHALIAEALQRGLYTTVKAYLETLSIAAVHDVEGESREVKR